MSNTLSASIVACALIAVSLPVAAGPAPAEAGAWLVVSEDGSAKIVALEPPGAAAGGSCSGNTPPVPLCTSGAHVRQGNSFGLGLSATNYRGTLENRLDWMSGLSQKTFKLRCDINFGTISCTFGGPFPSAGTRVVHNCRSYDLGTSTLGGSGSWGCRFID